MNLREAASKLEDEAGKYESNSCGMTDAEGEKWDEAWLQGMRDAAGHLRRWAEREVTTTVEMVHPWDDDGDGWCALCFHGDGDARCLRCGRSTGGPRVCECGDLRVAGPCAEALPEANPA